MDNNEQQEAKVEFVSESSLATIIKSEIDVQISTAKAYPRSVKKFIDKSISIATVTSDVAESCVYALKRRQQNKTTQQWEDKVIEGPSVRLAEICVSCYGNTRSAARVIANDGKTITAQGACHDLETNTLVTVEVRRSILNSQGRTYSQDMQIVTANAACAIAFRNAVFKVVPAALIHDVYEQVKLVAKGTAATLADRRTKAVKYFLDMGIKEEQICFELEVQNIEDIDLEKLSLLSGMKTALKNEESTLDELFPKPEEKTKLRGNAALNETNKMLQEEMRKKNGAK